MDRSKHQDNLTTGLITCWTEDADTEIRAAAEGSSSPGTIIGVVMRYGAVSYTHLTLPTIYSV